MTEYSFKQIKKILSDRKDSAENSQASFLRLSVTRNGVKTVDLSFPAGSARWLIDLIPDDVAQRIQAKGISLDEIQAKLNQSETLIPQTLFTLQESERVVRVWLE